MIIINRETYTLIVLGVLAIAWVVWILLRRFLPNRRAVYSYQDAQDTLAQELDKPQAELVRQISETLADIHPSGQKNINLSLGAYDLIARSLAPRLPDCASEQEVFKALDEEYYGWVGSTPMSEEFHDRLDQAARKIWWLWLNQRGILSTPAPEDKD